MDFVVVTNNRFRIGISYYKRVYQVKEKQNGLLLLFNTLDGKTFLDNLNLAEITINGEPAIDINALQEVVYNLSCVCDKDLEDLNYKIFDLSFDNTFE